MKCITRRIVLGAICVLTSVVPLLGITAVAAVDGGSHGPLPVSLVALIASPRQYNGGLVHVTGYLNLSYESNAVYFHEEDSR